MTYNPETKIQIQNPRNPKSKIQIQSPIGLTLPHKSLDHSASKDVWADGKWSCTLTKSFGEDLSVWGKKERGTSLGSV